MLELIKTLCTYGGVTGDEAKIASLIGDIAKKHADECYTDKMGNLIALKKGKSSEKKVVFSSNMDISGFIVTHVEENGKIRFSDLGACSAVALAYSRVILPSGAYGVIVPDSPASKDFKISDMYLDVGATNKEEAEKAVTLGDTFTTVPHLTPLQNGKIASNALDCRAGCAILLKVMEDCSPEYDTYFVFTAQKNFTSRGARASVFPLNPDVAITISASQREKAENKNLPPVTLGMGGGLLIKDRTAIYSERLINMVRDIADVKGLALQNEFSNLVGTDASVMQVATRGTEICNLTIPFSFFDTGIQMASISDIECIYAIVNELANTNIF